MANHTLTASVYSIGQSTNENYTNIRVDVYINRNSSTGAYWYGTCSGYIIVDGQRQDFSVNGYDCRNAQNTHIATKDFRVYHNADGTKAASWTVYFDGQNTSYVGAQTITGTYGCPTIARAASIGTVTWTDLESSFNATFTSPSSSFSYKLRVSIPYVQSIVTYDNYTSGTAKTLTQAQKNTIYQYLIDNKLSNCALGFVIETWSGNTKIGESSEPTKTFTMPALSTLSTNTNTYTTPATIAITITRNNSKYTHKLYHKLNNVNLSTTTPTTSESYTGVTSAAFGSKYPNATIGTLQLVLETYYDTILLGSTSKTVTINLQSYTLATPTLTLTLVNDNTTVNGWGIYLQNYSKYKATLSGASGQYSSTITKYVFGNNEQTSNTLTSSVITRSGTITVKGKYLDSRGKTSADASKSITVYEYYNPKITSISASRYNGTAVNEEGTQVQIKAVFNCASCNEKNAVSAVAYIKTESDTSWTSLGAIASNTAKVFTSVTLAINTVYQVKVIATDSLGNKTESQIVTITTASAIIDVLKGGTGVAIGKMASVANRFDVAWEINITNYLYINNKKAFQGTDGWLRINDGSAFSSGIYCGSGILRTDGNLQIGSNGSILNIKSGAATLNGSSILTLAKAFPVGAVYITYNNNNPGNFLGGTWEQFGQGRVLVGQGMGNDGSTSMSFAANSTGGEYKHKLNVSEMPSHNHFMTSKWYYGTKGQNSPVLVDDSSTNTETATFNTGNSGSNSAHNNIQPYLTVFFWQRTA